MRVGHEENNFNWIGINHRRVNENVVGVMMLEGYKTTFG